MPNRRSFLGAVSGVAASAMLAAPTAAQISPSPSPPPRPSAEAEAAAAAMRRFDPALTSDEVAQIARRIDATYGAGERLNPNKAATLSNADEPVTRFVVGERG